MDNGLIFPYPCVAVHTEAPVLTTQNLTDSAPSGVGRSGAAWDLRW
jgi:hypothetical protein